MQRICPMLVVGIVLLLGSLALGWTPKEYAVLSQMAAADLIADPLAPDSMKTWLNAALRQPAEPDSLEHFFLREYVGPFAPGLKGLAYWAAEPDLIAATDAGRSVRIKPFDLPERSLHYLDLERLNPDPQRRRFAVSLANKPAFVEIPRQVLDQRYENAGMLPFRAEQCYRRLVDAILERRLNDPGKPLRDDHAAKWAGYLAHYLADGWEPPHATEDYSFSWAFPDNTSAQTALLDAFGSRLGDNRSEEFPELRREYWNALLGARQEIARNGLPIKAKDTWEASVEALRYSYDFLPLIGQAGKAAYDPSGKMDLVAFYRYRNPSGNSPTLLQARATLQAMAVAQIRQAWLRAWEEAQRLQDDTPDPVRQWQP